MKDSNSLPSPSIIQRPGAPFEVQGTRDLSVCDVSSGFKAGCITLSLSLLPFTHATELSVDRQGLLAN